MGTKQIYKIESNGVVVTIEVPEEYACIIDDTIKYKCLFVEDCGCPMKDISMCPDKTWVKIKGE